MTYTNWMFLSFFFAVLGGLAADLVYKGPLTKRVLKKTPTVRDKAEEFIKLVEKTARNAAFGGVIIYETSFPLMANSTFRDYVLSRLSESKVVFEPLFTGPCKLDSDWQFSASIKKKNNVLSLGLDDPYF